MSTKQKVHWKPGRPVKRCEDDLNAYLQPARTNRDNNDFTSETTWQQAQANNTTHDPITTTTRTQPTTHEQSTYTTEVHDQTEGGANDDDVQYDDDIQLLLTELIRSGTSEAPKQPQHTDHNTANMVSHNALILISVHHILTFSTDAVTLHSKWHEI